MCSREYYEILKNSFFDIPEKWDPGLGIRNPYVRLKIQNLSFEIQDQGSIGGNRDSGPLPGNRDL